MPINIGVIVFLVVLVLAGVMYFRQNFQPGPDGLSDGEREYIRKRRRKEDEE